jgi:hypothetical protein
MSAPVWRLALGLSILGLVACAAPKVFVAPNFTRPPRVAILPMANDTNDLDGPVVVRQAIFERLAARGYQLVPLAEVDAKLKENGFTDGGQLKAAKPQDIGQWLGADGLVYSTLEEFNYINLGYYAQRTVKVHGRMIDAKTEAVLWEADRGWATRALATSNRQAEQVFATHMGAKWIEKLSHRPLQLETMEAVNRLLGTLP